MNIVNKIFFCTNNRFFRFAQIIEINYDSNFTMEMMITYDDGSLIDVINNVMKREKCMIIQFKLLFDDMEAYSDVIVHIIYNLFFYGSNECEENG